MVSQFLPEMFMIAVEQAWAWLKIGPGQNRTHFPSSLDYQKLELRLNIQLKKSLK